MEQVLTNYFKDIALGGVKLAIRLMSVPFAGHASVDVVFGFLVCMKVKY